MTEHESALSTFETRLTGTGLAGNRSLVTMWSFGVDRPYRCLVVGCLIFTKSGGTNAE